MSPELRSCDKIIDNGDTSHRQILGHILLDKRHPCGFVLPLNLEGGVILSQIHLWCLIGKIPTKCYFKEENRQIEDESILVKIMGSGVQD